MQAYGALVLAAPSRFARDGAAFQAATIAIDGAEDPPRRVEDFLRDMPQEPAYISNIPYAQMRASGLHHRHSLRCDDYLGTRVATLLDEAGLANAPAERQATWLAALHRHVLTHARDHLGLPPHPEGRTLALAIRRAYLKDRPAPMDPGERDALQEAFQRVTYSARAGEARRGKSRVIALRFHRQHYAETMLRVQAPFGAWRQIEPPRDGDVLAWARNLAESQAALFQVKVRFVGPQAREISQLVNIGSGARALHTDWGMAVNPRTWVAGPELDELSNLADITIERCRLADELVDGPFAGFEDDELSVLVGRLSATGSLVRLGPLRLAGRAQLDYVTGLLAESLWLSLIAVRSDMPDPTAVWVAANDRANCLRAALSIVMRRLEGVQVTGYSRGQVWIDVSTEEGEEAFHTRVAEAAYAARMVPPAMPPPPKSSPRLQLAQRLAGEIAQRPDPGRMYTAKTILGEAAALAGAA